MDPTTTLIEALINEAGPGADEGEHAQRGLAIRWTPDAIIWRRGRRDEARISTPPLRLQLSRGAIWPWWFGAWRRPWATIEMSVRSREAKLTLRATTDFARVEGLPSMQSEGERVPIEVLRGCLVSALSMGARVAHVPASMVHIPEPGGRWQRFLLGRLASHSKSAGSFDFKDLKLRDNDVAWLALRPEVSRAHSLYFPKNKLRDSSIEALFASPYLSPLRVLDLSHNKLGVASIEAIAGSSRSAKLRELTLDNNRFGVEGARALAASDQIRSLRGLHVKNCGLGSEGMIALAAAPWLETVEELDVRFNKIGAVGARALAESPYNGGLRRIWIRHGNRLSSDDMDLLRARLPKAEGIS